MTVTPESPTWTTWPQALRVIAFPRHLRATLTITFIVGTVLFAINQLDTVLNGDATAATWIKGAVTYLVPFTVSNLGVLTAAHAKRHR